MRGQVGGVASGRYDPLSVPFEAAQADVLAELEALTAEVEGWVDQVVEGSGDAGSAPRSPPSDCSCGAIPLNVQGTANVKVPPQATAAHLC